MPDIIQLLPDNVANQIAAGEVIQRPASVVKELVENAIDAGADQIHLIIKDAGKTLIQVVDSGSGMSETDARLSLERHATSKIRKADDLFTLHTMGFRGEALASIAAISHLEIKTRRQEDETGTTIRVEGSEVKEQVPDAIPVGTTISIKNLFYNVPARRNFLKSDNVEYRHILEEFNRVVLVYPDLKFSFTHNNTLVYKLENDSLKKRIVDVFGHNMNKKLVPISISTSLADIHGFIGKPEFARKKRGEQYFFVNNRFIKHPYFHHAVAESFKELLPEGYFPSYYIYLKVDPSRLDVNIHPTKTEVNFQDRTAIYSVLRSLVKQGIGQFNLAPSLDFDMDQSLNLGGAPKDPADIKPPTITIDPEYNPFKNTAGTQQKMETFRQKNNRENWSELYKIEPRGGHHEPAQTIPANINFDDVPEQHADQTRIAADFDQVMSSQETLLQFSGQYIVSNVKSGLMLVDQNAAHERILYEKLLLRLKKRQQCSQQQLFPHHVTFSAEDVAIINELHEDLKYAGFNMEPINNHTFIISGLPADLNENEDVSGFLDNMLESYKLNQQEMKDDRTINLAYSMAKNLAIKPGKKLEKEEMRNVIDNLFACEVPDKSPSGKSTVVIIHPEEIKQKFK